MARIAEGLISKDNKLGARTVGALQSVYLTGQFINILQERLEAKRQYLLDTYGSAKDYSMYDFRPAIQGLHTFGRYTRLARMADRQEQNVPALPHFELVDRRTVEQCEDWTTARMVSGRHFEVVVDGPFARTQEEETISLWRCLQARIGLKHRRLARLGRLPARDAWRHRWAAVGRSQVAVT